MTSAAYDLLAEDNFQSFGLVAKTDDYDELASQAMSYASSFPEKVLKPILTETLYTNAKQQKQQVLSNADELQKFLETKIQNIK